MLNASVRLLSLVVLVAFCFAGVPAGAQDTFKDAKKEFEAGKKESSAAKMGRAVEQIAALQTAEARDYLLGVLADDQKDRKQKRPGLPGEVRKKVILCLSMYADEESVKKIGEAVI